MRFVVSALKTRKLFKLSTLGLLCVLLFSSYGFSGETPEIHSSNQVGLGWVLYSDRSDFTAEAEAISELFCAGVESDGKIASLSSDRFTMISRDAPVRKKGEYWDKQGNIDIRSFETEFDEKLSALEKSDEPPVFYLAISSHGHPGSLSREHLDSIRYKRLFGMIFDKLEQFKKKTGKEVTLKVLLSACYSFSVADAIKYQISSESGKYNNGGDSKFTHRVDIIASSTECDLSYSRGTVFGWDTFFTKLQSHVEDYTSTPSGSCLDHKNWYPLCRQQGTTSVVRFVTWSSYYPYLKEFEKAAIKDGDEKAYNIYRLQRMRPAVDYVQKEGDYLHFLKNGSAEQKENMLYQVLKENQKMSDEFLTLILDYIPTKEPYSPTVMEKIIDLLSKQNKSAIPKIAKLYERLKDVQFKGKILNRFIRDYPEVFEPLARKGLKSKDGMMRYYSYKAIASLIQHKPESVEKHDEIILEISRNWKNDLRSNGAIPALELEMRISNDIETISRHIDDFLDAFHLDYLVATAARLWADEKKNKQNEILIEKIVHRAASEKNKSTIMDLARFSSFEEVIKSVLLEYLKNPSNEDVLSYLEELLRIVENIEFSPELLKKIVQSFKDGKKDESLLLLLSKQRALDRLPKELKEIISEYLIQLRKDNPEIIKEANYYRNLILADTDQSYQLLFELIKKGELSEKTVADVVNTQYYNYTEDAKKFIRIISINPDFVMPIIINSTKYQLGMMVDKNENLYPYLDKIFFTNPHPDRFKNYSELLFKLPLYVKAHQDELKGLLNSLPPESASKIIILLVKAGVRIDQKMLSSLKEAIQTNGLSADEIRSLNEYSFSSYLGKDKAFDDTLVDYLVNGDASSLLGNVRLFLLEAKESRYDHFKKKLKETIRDSYFHDRINIYNKGEAIEILHLLGDDFNGFSFEKNVAPFLFREKFADYDLNNTLAAIKLIPLLSQSDQEISILALKSYAENGIYHCELEAIQAMGNLPKKYHEEITEYVKNYLTKKADDPTITTDRITAGLLTLIRVSQNVSETSKWIRALQTRDKKSYGVPTLKDLRTVLQQSNDRHPQYMEALKYLKE